MSKKRSTIYLSERDDELLSHWAEKLDMSKSEFVMLTVNHYVNYVNNDYDVPTAMVQRTNQILQALIELESTVIESNKTMQAGFDSITGVVRGNYLLDEGDIDG